MKKIILSKVHSSPSPEGVHQEADQEAGSSTQEACSSSQEACTSSQEAADKPPFQPPLPIGPPPPDSPTRIQIKREILDDGYPDTTDYKVKIPIFDVKCKQEVAPVDPRPLCRRFARGTCTNGSSCIFRHEVAQPRSDRNLKFCWDFQNKGCSRPVCKHVHATIFEEQHYYRTGDLPPSALAHHKKENVMQNKDMSNNNVNANNVQMAKDRRLRLGKYQTFSPIVEECQEDKSKFKRLWDENNVGSGRPDFVASGPLEKKCKNCDKIEYSMEVTKNKMKEKLRTLVRLKEDTGEVTKKSQRLFNFIQSIMTLNSMFPGKDVEGLFAELLEVTKHNNALSSDSPSH